MPVASRLGRQYLPAGVWDTLQGPNVQGPNDATEVGVCRFGAAPYIPAISLEKPLYVRERNDGLYRPITYLLAKIFDEIFITVISSLVFSAAVFYAVSLQGSFIVFWLNYLVTLSTGIVLAYVVATISPNMEIANAALPTYAVRP